MEYHPERSAFAERLSGCMEEVVAPFSGLIARCCKPKYSAPDDLFSGKGALYADGRWMLRSARPVAYASLELETAFSESLTAGRYFGFPEMSATPILMVSANCDLKRTIDLRDGKNQKPLKIPKDLLTTLDWRAENRKRREAASQALGWAIAESGIEAIIVPSAAKSDGANIVCFPDNFGPDSTIFLENEIEWPNP